MSKHSRILFDEIAHVLLETRTRLDGTGFKSCMRDAFEAIRFFAPPSGRPEIVSYSVLFKPGGR